MSSPSIAPYFPFKRMKISRQTVEASSPSALIYLQPDQRYRPICHACQNTAATVHTKGQHRYIQDLSMADRAIWLDVEYRKVWCEH